MSNLSKVIGLIAFISTEGVVRNTKDNVVTLTGPAGIKCGEESMEIAASDIASSLIALGMSPAAKNDQNQTLGDYFGSCRGNRTYQIQFINANHWRIMKVIKPGQAPIAAPAV